MAEEYSTGAQEAILKPQRRKERKEGAEVQI
jgi:hypothetical protein